jgi:O-antigen ligase
MRTSQLRKADLEQGLAGGLNLGPRKWDAQTVAASLAVLFALLLGVTIAQEKWLFLIAIGLMPLVILWPVEFSLGAFAMLIPFDSVGAMGSEKTGTTVAFVVGAAAGGLLLFTGMAGRRLEKPRPQAVAWALFVAWAAISSLWALDFRMALDFLPTAAALFTIYFITASLRISQKEFTWVVACTILGGLAAALFAIYSFRNGVSYHGLMTMRSSLIIGDRETDPNNFANNLLLPLSLAAGVFLSLHRGVAKVAMFGVTATIFISIVFTMSRGALLSVFAMTMVYAYRFRLKLWALALIPTAIGGILLVAAPTLLFQRMSNAVTSGGAGRTSIWRAGFVAFQHYGIVGAGLGNFPAAFDQFAGEATHFEGFGRGSHNIYLGVSVELGIVGFLLLLNALRIDLRGRKFADTISPFHAAVACEAAAWGMLVGGFFLDILWKKGFWLVWILLAVATKMQKARAGIPSSVIR